MILVQYGIGETQRLIAMLTGAGYRVAASVKTEYGGELAGRGGAEEIVFLPENQPEISQLLRNKGISLVVDASHPFKNPLSQLLGAACSETGIPCLRFYRKETKIPANNLVYCVYSWEDAARRAAELGETIFLTTGSNNLDVFLKCPALKNKRLVVRVLPEYRVIKKCQDMGIYPRDIVALHGPFSVKFNKAMFQAYKAGVIVTRDGGSAGGTETKITAALALKIPVVLIKREQPLKPGAPETCEQVLECVRKILDCSRME